MSVVEDETQPGLRTNSRIQDVVAKKHQQFGVGDVAIDATDARSNGVLPHTSSLFYPSPSASFSPHPPRLTSLDSMRRTWLLLLAWPQIRVALPVLLLIAPIILYWLGTHLWRWEPVYYSFCVAYLCGIATHSIAKDHTASTLDNPTDQKFRPSRLFDSDEISH
jgi:MFS family permease